MKIRQIDEAGQVVEVSKGRGERQARTASVRVTRAQAKAHLGKNRRGGSGAKSIGTKVSKSIATGRHPASAELRHKRTQVALLLQEPAVRTPPMIAAEHAAVFAQAKQNLLAQRKHAQ
jgi:hypothetical protein